MGSLIQSGGAHGRESEADLFLREIGQANLEVRVICKPPGDLGCCYPWKMGSWRRGAAECSIRLAGDYLFGQASRTILCRLGSCDLGQPGAIVPGQPVGRT